MELQCNGIVIYTCVQFYNNKFCIGFNRISYDFILL